MTVSGWLFLQVADDHSIVHEANLNNILLFSFRSKAFFGKKKVFFMHFLVFFFLELSKCEFARFCV